MDEVQIQGILLRSILDRMEIVDLLAQVAVTVDMRDWTALRQCFAEEVDLDCSALYGHMPRPLHVDEVVGLWRQRLSLFTTTQHNLTNHTVTVDGDGAMCVVSIYIQHCLATTTSRSLWNVGGYAAVGLIRTERGWKVQQGKLTILWEQGDRPASNLLSQ